MRSDAPDLLCPRDAGRLSIREWDLAQYGFCARCGGVWIGRAELDKLVEQSLTPPAVYPEAELRILEGTALCPCAGQPLMNRVTRDEVTLDICPACQAIWFDAGEIQCVLAVERHAALRKGLPPGWAGEPVGPLEEAGRVLNLFEAVALLLRIFGSLLR
jgi:Zn-finger nucleic acid-binding protein